MEHAAHHTRPGPQEHSFDEELTPAGAGQDHLGLHDLRKVRLTISADLGQCAMLVREVLELRRGSVLPLNKLAGELADVSINGVPFAKGEIVVLGDNLHVRIAEIFGADGTQGSAHG